MPTYEGYFWLEDEDSAVIVFFSPILLGYMICGSDQLQPYGEDDILTPVKFPDED